MKSYSFLVAFFICLFTNAQVDTAQVVVPNRTNSKKTLDKPYVILISADGFRYDYMKKYKPKTLRKLAKDGVWAKKGMYPSYPSATFPNHYSIATGLYPSHHGIVSNVFYDPARDEKYVIGSKTVRDGSWYGGTPLWALAEKQGMVAASLFWVGSESAAGRARPSYYYHYNEKFSGQDKAKIIKNWLTLPEEKRPHFITLYFPEVDHAGHRFGPGSQQTQKAVQTVDQAIKTLVKTLKPLDIPINYIFVSDHGMLAINPKNYIPFPKIDTDKFVMINNSTMVNITAKNSADIKPLYEHLRKKPQQAYKIYLAKNVPEKLHYSSREDSTRRIGDIILVPKGKRIFVNPSGKKPSVGKHGFNPYKIPQMKATYFSWGPAFKTHKTIKSFQNVNIYPLIANILNLKITGAIDGNFEVLQKTLKK